jgi:ketosteroid isomerase-like protein
MSIEKNVQTVKDFFAAMGRGDKQGLLALCADDIEWIIPGKDWPLAGTHRGHSGLEGLLQKTSEMEISSPRPPEYVAQGDRVLLVGFAKGKVKATNKAFEDDWVFAITVRNGKLTNIREYSTRRHWRGPPRWVRAWGSPPKKLVEQGWSVRALHR